MNIVYLDANFLMIPVQLKIDVYQEISEIVPHPFKFVVLSAVFEELDKKVARRKNKSQLAKEYAMARQILESKEYEISKKNKPSGMLVDDLILQEALKHQEASNKVFLATNDKDLKRKCKKEGLPTIFIRKGKQVAIQNH